MRRHTTRPQRLSSWKSLAVCTLCTVLIGVLVLALQSYHNEEAQWLRQSTHRVRGPSCPARGTYACVAHSYSEALGCYTLAKSLILSKTTCPITVLTTEAVSSRTSSWIMTELGAQVRCRVLNPEGLRPLDAKLLDVHLWKALRDFDRVIWLGHDTIVLRRMDELFEHAELSATQDLAVDLIGVNHFSTALMVIAPNDETHERLTEKLLAEQKTLTVSARLFLNTFFPHWNRLSQSWMTPAWMLSATPDIDVVTSWRSLYAIHYSGGLRPWEKTMGSKESADRNMRALYRLWWRIYEHENFSNIDLTVGTVFAEPMSWMERLQLLCFSVVALTTLCWALVLYTGCHNSGSFVIRPRGEVLL